MTDQEMIQKYNQAAREVGDMRGEIDDLFTELNDIEIDMGEIITIWLKSHKCSCGLTGVGSSCEHDKN